MTIKEIMALTDLSNQTIINKIKELYPTKIEHGKTTKLNQEESINVVKELKVEVSKNLTVNNTQISMNDVMFSIKALADTVNYSMQAFNSRLENIEKIFENKIEERKLLLPAPEKSDRENIRQIINSYAKRKNINHSVVWGKLYQESYYRLNINLRERAENRGLSIIDYAEKENLISELLSIATEIFI